MLGYLKAALPTIQFTTGLQLANSPDLIPGATPSYIPVYTFNMKYPITGIQAGWGSNAAVPAHREIDEWYPSSDPRDKDQVNLYIQALINFQNIPADEKLSFF